jgi:Excalibur calcium-binding domain
MFRWASLVTVVSAIAILVFAASAQSAGSLLPRKYQNCKALNRRYPHGVGRFGARDHTSGTPVTNFRRSNRLYRLNKGLDRDKDGIACEKR